MAKRGRPPKHGAKALKRRLDLRVSETEKTAFKLAAENADQDLSVWIRVVLHRAVSEQLAKVMDVQTNLSGARHGNHRKANANSIGSM